MNNCRRVNYYEWKGRAAPKVFAGQAWFHEFSTSYEEFDNGPGLFPVAIIETDAGEVRVVSADMITFVNPISSSRVIPVEMVFSKVAP